MPAKRTRRKRKPYQSQNIGPTPETEAKLEADPLQAAVEAHTPSAWKQPCERAADEIRAIYSAVTGQLTLRGQRLAREARGRYEMPDSLAEAHRDRYLPWVEANPPRVVDWALTLVVDREPLNNEDRESSAAKALIDYARRL